MPSKDPEMQRSRETPDLFFAIKNAFELGKEWLPYPAPKNGDEAYNVETRTYHVIMKIAGYARLPMTFYANDFFTILWDRASPAQRERFCAGSNLTKARVDPARWDAMFFSQIRAANRAEQAAIHFIDGQYYSVVKNIQDYALKPPTQRDHFTILWEEASPRQRIKIAAYMVIYNEVRADRWTEINRTALTYLPAPPVLFRDPFDDPVAARHRVP
jgi:hypothetical protein